MLRLYDFRCSSTDEVYERMVDSEVREVSCTCGAISNRIISPIKFHLDNSFPGYADKWARDHERGGKAGKGNG